MAGQVGVIMPKLEERGKCVKINVVLLLLVVVAVQTPKAAAQSPGTFTATGNMTTPRSFPTATLLADGRVLIAGENVFDPRGPAQARAELYDPRTRTFTATGNMTPRAGHTATLLPDGKVLIAGGAIPRTGSLEDLVLASAELYDPGTGTFSATGQMSTARHGAIATLLNNGKVLIAGGAYFGQGVNPLTCAGFTRQTACFPIGAELYDPDTGTFTATGDMTSYFADTATLLPNGKVLITEGNPQVGPYLTAAELYEPTTGKFTFAGYATTNHSGPTVTLMMNGKVLIAGGDMGDGDGGSFIAESYDPASGTFSRTGNMSVAREQHTATLLPDGSVLFAGGYTVPDLAASAEIYDPLKEAFSRTASMSTARELHTATLLVDGTVLIAGGYQSLSSAELYTPQVLVPAPVLLSLLGDGKGQAAILHGNTSQVASSDNPAVIGEALEIYATGLTDGSVIPAQVAIGGRMAAVLWFGKAPGYAELNQINVRVPAGVTPGPAVPVRLIYIGRPSNPVTIGVR